MRIAALIVAAGRGLRAGAGEPKQFRSLGGRRVLTWTASIFRHHPGIFRVLAVVNPQDAERLADVEAELGEKLETCPGGATRTESVRAGLAALGPEGADAVLIHDAARPFASQALIDRLIEQLEAGRSAIPVLPSTDALTRVDEGGALADPVDREQVFAAQTPQAFPLPALLAAYEQLGDRSLPDDAAVMRAAGETVRTVPGESGNYKLTRAEDFMRADAELNARTLTVTGQGYDVHRLVPGDHIWLCGVKIDSALSLKGHSDADAPLHALADAVLGAAGAGDIGQHFPPSDPQWKGASSDQFLLHALKLLAEAGGRLTHADLTIISEKPRIGPHREVMRARLAELLDLPLKRVNLKATTTEGLGFTGRVEGLAAQAVVTAQINPEIDE
jgi:2-C-methyl-D-erythritol 4-phosphate cytidylyltransferase/2-C-methyl-D-erythritol 2,4-cyclodiphosphate synthase